MEKDTEKMRVAVIAECETVCPYKPFAYRPETEFWFTIVPMSTGNGAVEYRIKRDDEYGGKTYVRVNQEMPEQDVFCAYRLLGLSERDAVEAERAEMMNTVDALSAMVSVDPVAFAALEAKNAALVAGLETIKQGYGLEHGLLKGERPVINSLGEYIEELIAANEKGGVNG